MSAILVSLLSKFWPVLVGVLGAAGGTLFAIVKTKAAKADVAAAGQQVAETKQQAAEQQAAVLAANAAASDASASAVVSRQKIEDATASQTPKEVQNELDQWRG